MDLMSPIKDHHSERRLFGTRVILSAVIGGQARIGQGWQMLMSALGAGRSISLPALSAGTARLAARGTPTPPSRAARRSRGSPAPRRLMRWP